MKIVNGKLLGQPKSDLEIFKERQNQCNLELTISLEKLEHRINRAETTLQGEALREALFRRLEDYVRQLEERCQLLEQEQKQVKTKQQQWKYLEDTKISQIENNLIKIKQQNPQKFLWLTFGSSIIVGIISLCNSDCYFCSDDIFSLSDEKIAFSSGVIEETNPANSLIL